VQKFNLAECMHTPDGEVPNVARGTRVLRLSAAGKQVKTRS